MELLLVVIGKLNFAAAYEERRFFGKCGGFDLYISFSSINFKRANVIAEAISLTYRNMFDLFGELLLSKFIESVVLEIQNELFASLAERNVSGFSLKVITFLR